MGIPAAIGAAGELRHENSLHANAHSCTHVGAENTKRITMAAEIYRKHVPRSGTF